MEDLGERVENGVEAEEDGEEETWASGVAEGSCFEAGCYGDDEKGVPVGDFQIFRQFMKTDRRRKTHCKNIQNNRRSRKM